MRTWHCTPGFRGMAAWFRPLVLSLLLGGVGPLDAQEPPDSVVPLEPVTVRILRSGVGTGTPFPVSVASGDELTRATGGAFLEEALRAVPGVQIQNRFNLASGERLAVRGFGARAQFGIRGIRVLVDGIPATLADGQTALDHLELSGLGRVEVLRGPGGALYGNSAGGVLHFTTRPPARGLTVAGEASSGTHGLGTWQATASGGNAERGFRATVSGFTFDGFRLDPVAADGTAFGSAKRTLVNLTGYARVAGGDLHVAVNGMDMAGDNPGSLARSALADGARPAFRFNVLQRTREDVRQAQAGLAWTGPVGGLDADVAAWGIRRDFLGAIPPAVVTFDRNAGGARGVVRQTRRAGSTSLTLGLGAEVEFMSDDRSNRENERGTPGALTLDQDESVRGTAFFGQARWDLDPRIGVLSALRYDRFTFRADDRFLTDGADDSGERLMDAVTPSVGFVAHASETVEVFGSLSAFFETPTTTELTNRPDGAGGFNTELEPTRGRTVEGGVRGRAGARFAWEATLFHTRLEDELVPFEVPSAPGRSFFRNAGTSRHTGWEMLVDARPGPGLSTRVAYTRVDARYDDYSVDGVDFSGNRVPGLAPWRVDGRIGWENGPVFVEFRGLATAAVPVDDGNSDEADGYFLGDLRAGLDGLTAGSVNLSPWLAVANLFDRNYTTAVVVNAFGGRYFEPGPGRTLRVGMGVRWNSR